MIDPNQTTHRCMCRDCGPVGCGYDGEGHCQTCAEKMTAEREPGEGEFPYYNVVVTRFGHDGQPQHIEFDGYGLLRELLDDIEKEAEDRGWFGDSP